MIKSINNIKSKGFTIVELLVVIVVIGILAAITVVSYSGITNKAKQGRAQSNAYSIRDMAETYAGTQGKYPSTLAELTSTALAVPSGVTATGTDPTTGNGETTVRLYTCAKTVANDSAKIAYWDYTAPAVAYVYLNGATLLTSCTAI